MGPGLNETLRQLGKKHLYLQYLPLEEAIETCHYLEMLYIRLQKKNEELSSLKNQKIKQNRFAAVKTASGSPRTLNWFNLTILFCQREKALPNNMILWQGIKKQPQKWVDNLK